MNDTKLRDFNSHQLESLYFAVCFRLETLHNRADKSDQVVDLELWRVQILNAYGNVRMQERTAQN